MPSKIQSESPFRLRGVFFAALILAGGGFISGVVYMRAHADTLQPCPAVTSLEHRER